VKQRGRIITGACHICNEPIANAGSTSLYCTPCRLYAVKVQTAAGNSLRKLVKNGEIAAAHTLTCTDCGKPAYCYDHRSYEPPVIEPVCILCNARRGPGLYPPRVQSLAKRLEVNGERK
jgi:hypothetical protein